MAVDRVQTSMGAPDMERALNPTRAWEVELLGLADGFIVEGGGEWSGPEELLRLCQLGR